ncbi:hypothetical protein [Nocardioides sp. CER19]|uniref:hypothetical protein n=1 Tax=Nocardioides sp. CER19 TaxID=3038538 RepID=UPI00244816B7|nr:hypothetical protein [Nocardioides sp. CER19]MDH2414176.1 hypothetical protein [Nocardioides sp. CER19]
MTLQQPRPAVRALRRRHRLPPLGLWWLSPVGAVLLVLPASLIGAWLIGDARYRTDWRTPKELTDSFTVLMLLGLVAFVVAAGWWQLRGGEVWRGRWPVLSEDARAVMTLAATWTFRGTLFGYLALGAIGVARGVPPSVLVTAATSFSTDDSIKSAFAPIAGVSSFTQLGIAHTVLAGLLLRPRRDRAWTRTDRRVRRQLAVVLLLALARAFLLSERLAVLELVVPLVAIGALRLSVATRPAVRRAARLAPVVLAPLLLAVFALFEYTRSWNFYRNSGATSFWDFVVVRFAGYYATAYNNAAILYEHGRFPGRLPYWVVEFFWTAPGISQLDLYGRLAGGEAEQSAFTATQQYGNPEFNNPGGLGVPFVDLGALGGLAFMAALGVLCGWVWARLRAGRPSGMLLYPVFLVGLYELPRYLYLTEGRVLPALVVLILVARRLERGRAADVTLRVRRALGRRPRVTT